MISAFVPIRTGGERFPDKSFKVFNGKPLWMYILETLGQVPDIDEIIVNTDSQELLAHGIMEKVRFAERPEHLRVDPIGADLAIYDMTLAKNDTFLQTHCTNPLLTAETICKAIAAFGKSCNDSLFCVTKHQSRFYDFNSRPINHETHNIIRNQDLLPVYEDVGCTFIFTRESFAKTGSRMGKSPMMFEVSRTEALDIDTPEDFRIVEAVAIRGGKHREFC